MQSNPFIESVPYRIAGILALLVIWLVHALALVVYGQMDWIAALSDGIVYVCLFAVSGFLFWDELLYVQASGDYVTLFYNIRSVYKRADDEIF